MDIPDWPFWNITQQNSGENISSSISSQVRLMETQAPGTISSPERATEINPEFSPRAMFPDDDVLKLDSFQDRDDLVGFTWEEAKTSDQISSFNFVSQRNLIANSSSLPNHEQVLPGGQNTTNCVSVTTNTMEESGDISMILSDCQNLYNSCTNNTESSGESDKRDISNPESNKNINPGRIKRVNCNSSRTGKGKNSSNPKARLSKMEIDCGIALETAPKPRKARQEKKATNSSNINFQGQSSSAKTSTILEEEYHPDDNAQFKEIIYCAAALKPVNLDIEVVNKPKRKNVKISSDPQTAAARQRRERISERIRILQRLVPGGNRLDTATMLEEAANYLKFLKSQIKALENLGHKSDAVSCLPMNLVFSPFPFYHSFPMTSPTPYQTHENTHHSQDH